MVVFMATLQRLTYCFSCFTHPLLESCPLSTHYHGLAAGYEGMQQ